MSDIRITKPHKLSVDQIKSYLPKLAHKLENQLDLDCELVHNGATFRRTGASGSLQFDSEQLTIDIKLGFLLKPMKGLIEKEITTRLEELIPS
jgi:putative polyhydroxyalkanoate system protein